MTAVSLSPRRWVPPALSVLAILGLLELLSRAEIIPSRHFPPMSEVASTLAGRLGSSEQWTAIAQTLEGWAAGLSVAILLAVPLGIVIGSSEVLYRAVRPIIEFLRPVPSVALIPLAALLYGTGFQSKVFLVVFASFWPLLVQALYGVKDVDPVATDTARSFKVSSAQRLLHVTLPSALPYLATGVRIASSVALILAVTAEIVIGAPGLGREINVARSGGAVDLMYALIVLTGLLGWMLNSVVARAEHRLLRWHSAHRPQEVMA